jgi:hypothetical protein
MNSESAYAAVALALPPMFTVMVETTPALGHPTRAMVPHSPVAVPY